MKKANLFATFSIAALATVMAFALVKGNPLTLHGEECQHTHVEFYEGVAPTLDSTGRPGHYACCECHRAWYDEARTQEIAGRQENPAVADFAAKTAGTAINKDDVDSTDLITAVNPGKVKWSEQNDIVNSPKVSTADKMEYYTIDGRNALRFSFDYDGLSDENKARIKNGTTDPSGAPSTSGDVANAGYTETRFIYSGTISKITFDYKYWDLNRDLASDGGPSPTHMMAQAHDTQGYNYEAMELVNDNTWHTCTINLDQHRTIDFFILKIHHFHGEFYISNLGVAHDGFATNTSNIGYTEFCSECGEGSGLVTEPVIQNGQTYGANLDMFSNDTTTDGDGVVLSPLGQMLYQPAGQDLHVYGSLRSIQLPRINFSLYNNVVFPFATNNDPANGHIITIGQGGSSDNLLGADALKNAKGNLEVKLNEERTALVCTFTANGAQPITFQVTDTNVINGTSSLELTANACSWRWICFRVLLNHTHSGDVVDSTTRFGTKVVLCPDCGTEVPVEDQLMTTVVGFTSPGQFGINGQDISSSKRDPYAVEGAIQISFELGQVKLPKVQFNKFHEIKIGVGIDHFDDYRCTFGLDSNDQFTYDTIKNSKTGEFIFTYEEGVLTLQVMWGGVELDERTITDQDIVMGMKSLTVLTTDHYGRPGAEAPATSWRTFFINYIHSEHIGEIVVSTTRIGAKVISCCCGESVDSDEMMTDEDIDLSALYGAKHGDDPVPYYTGDPSEGEGKDTNSLQFTMANGTITMPRVQFDKYSKVVFNFGVDHWGSLDCSLGLETADDLLPFDIIKTKAKGVMEFVYDSGTGNMSLEVKYDDVVKASATITDANVISGVSGLVFKVATTSGRSFFINSINVTLQ